MTTIEQKIFNIISRKKNARIQYIASSAGVSSAYASLVCEGLHRRGHINFVRGLAVIAVLADTYEPLTAPTAPAEESQVSEEQAGGEPTAEEKAGVESEAESSPQATPISSFRNLKENTIVALADAGYRTVGDLAEVPISKLMSAGGMNVKQAADLINRARKELGMLS